MFQTKLRLNFFDCDPAGIIFYANLFKMAHSGYEQFMSSLIPDRNFFFDDECVLPIVHTEADYLKPLKAFDEVECEIKVNKTGTSSFELSYIFKVNNEIYATASTVHVCVSKKSFKKKNLPEELMNRLIRD